MASRRRLGIELEGPFFQRDPARTCRANIRDFMDRVAEIGEAEVKRRLDSGSSAAATRPYVVGRTRALSGRRWQCTARISVSTAGLTRAAAIQRQAIAAGRHNPTSSSGRRLGTTKGAEGETHAFRDARASTIAAANRSADMLTKDLT